MIIRVHLHLTKQGVEFPSAINCKPVGKSANCGKRKLYTVKTTCIASGGNTELLKLPYYILLINCL